MKSYFNNTEKPVAWHTIVDRTVGVTDAGRIGGTEDTVVGAGRTATDVDLEGDIEEHIEDEVPITLVDTDQVLAMVEESILALDLVAECLVALQRHRRGPLTFPPVSSHRPDCQKSTK